VAGLMLNRVFLQCFLLSWFALITTAQVQAIKINKDTNKIKDEGPSVDNCWSDDEDSEVKITALDSDLDYNQCEAEDLPDYINYENLKKLMRKSINDCDIVGITIVYLYARNAQIRLAKCSVYTGVAGAVCIGIAPITNCFTLIFGVPLVACCAAGAVEAYTFGKLKYHAQDYLKHNLSNVTYKIITTHLNDISDITKSQIADLLEKEGYDANVLRNYKPNR
jgi:hypothetical protein